MYNRHMNKVAVITRTKDRPVFLDRAFKSVHNQSFDNFVHVVINDGGDVEQIEKQVSSLPVTWKNKIKLFHRPIASGAPDTIFNESIDRVESEYVAIHDSDDTWHPEFLSHTVKMLDEGCDGVVVRTDKVIESVSGDNIKTIKTSHYMPEMSVVSLYKQCIDNQLTPISFIYKRSVYEEVGKYDESLPVVGDWEFGIRFLMKTDVEYLDPGFPLAFYHHRKSTGDNSFSKHNHRLYVTKVANKYLRDEIKSGKLLIGYIMSDLKYRQDVRHGAFKRLIPKKILNRKKPRV